MNFNIISVALLSIVACLIILEIIRAVNRGFKKTVVSLASIFAAVFSSIVITNFVSDLIAAPLVNLVDSKFQIAQKVKDIPSINKILFAYVDAAISPIVFIVVFILVRILISVVLTIVLKKQENRKVVRLYEDENAPEHKKNPKVLNALLGAFCGLLISVVFVSPFMGTLKVGTGVLRSINSENSSIKISFNKSFVKLVDVCSKDAVGNVVYYCGGNLIYKAVATSNLNDNYFALEKEAKATVVSAGNIFKSGNFFSNIDSSTQEERNSMRNLDKEINGAETVKSIYADIVPELSKKWLNGDDFKGMKKPRVNRVCETFFNKMLFVCKSSTPDTVGEDFATMVNVYIIAYENNMLSSENYKQMLERAKATGAFEEIKKELSENPRMAGISLEVEEITIKSVASALKNFNFENYDNLMSNLANTLNVAMNYEGEARKQYIANLTRGYIHDYGIDIGDDVVNEVSERFVDEVMDGKTYVTVDDVKAFWDKYSESANGS